MTIEYIDRMPSMTEYAEGKRIDPKYTDLISRADAIEAVARFRNIDGVSVWHNGIKESLRVAIIAELSALPSAEAVSREECNCVFSKPKIKLPKKAGEFDFSNVEIVVRCKDCRHYESITDGYGMCKKRQTVLTTQRDDDFCSYGERR